MSSTKNSDPPATEPTSISSLPCDLLLNCVARVSRLYYPTLSLVSKKFRSIVSSPELYEIRSLLKRTESCLYLCLRVPLEPNTYWFTLAKKSSGRNLLVPIPSLRFLPPAQSSSLVAVGSKIYEIGGHEPWPEPSSTVSVLDCRSHTWHPAPSMRVERITSTARFLDGKIYVAGEFKSSLKWVEVFDPNTQTWSSVTNRGVENRHGGKIKSFALEGKFYLFGDKGGVVYNPKEGRWNPVGVDTGMDFVVRFWYCVIDNVLFFWAPGVFRWYDSKVRRWKDLNGVEDLPEFSSIRDCKLVDHGGKIAVFWDEYVFSGVYKEHMVWCAEIALERRNDGNEIWGKVEWFGAVLTVHNSCFLCDMNVLSVTL